MINESNIGRCSRCDLSTFKDVYSEGKEHRWCTYYDNFCQRSARNCLAPSKGYRTGGKR